MPEVVVNSALFEEVAPSVLFHSCVSVAAHVADGTVYQSKDIQGGKCSYGGCLPLSSRQ